MSDLRASLVLVADGGQLKAVLKTAEGDVRSFSSTTDAASATVVAAAAKQEAAVKRAAAAEATAAAASAAAATQRADAADREAARRVEAAARAAAAEAKAAASAATAVSAKAVADLEAAKAMDVATASAAKFGGALASQKAQLEGFFALNRAGQAELRAAFVNAGQALAAGMNPLMVLQTEAAQVIGAFVQGGKISVSTLVGVGGAAAVAAAALGLVVTGYIRGTEQSAEFNRMLQLTGDAAGLTADRINAIAAASTGLGDIGPTAARKVALAYAETGKIGADTIQRLTAITADYAKATGEDAVAAAAELSKLFSDPAKGAKELDDQLNLLSSAQRRTIDDFAAQGNVTAAQTALLDQLIPRIDRAAQHVGVLSKAWQAFMAGLGKINDDVNSIGRTPSPQEQIPGLQATVDQDRSYLANQRAQHLDTSEAEAQLNADLALLNKAKEDAADAIKKGIIDAEVAGLRDVGKSLEDSNRAFDPFAVKQRDLENQLTKSTAAVEAFNDAVNNSSITAGNPGLKAELQQGLDIAKQAQQDAQDAIAALRTPAQAALDSLGIARQVAATPQVNRQAQEAYLSTLDQAQHSNDPNVFRNAGLIAETEKQKVILQQTQAIRDQNQEVDLNTALTLKAADAWTRSASEGAAADAERDAALKALSSPIDATAEKMRRLAAAAADAAEKGAQQLASLRQQADQQEALADASLRGISAEHAAELNGKIAEATQGLRDQLANAADPATAEKIKSEIAGITDEVIRLDDAANKLNFGHALQGQADQLTLLQKQLQLVNANNEARDVGLAQAQAEIDLAHMHVDVLSDEGRQYIANATNIAKMNDQLERQRAIAQELPGFFDQMFDRIGSGLTNLSLQTGNFMQSVQNLGAAVESEVVQEAVKLGLVNPAKNFLNGDDQLPTLLSAFGGSSQNASLLSGTNGIGSWLAQLVGTNSAVYSNGIQVGTTLPPWATFLNSGVGTGLVGGAASAGITAASGGNTLQTILAGGGSLAGGIIGAYYGNAGLGASAGGFLGNLLGGLFGGDDEKKPPKQKSITNISADASGYFGVGSTSTKNTGDNTSALGTNAINAVNAFLASIGGTVTSQLSGLNQIYYSGRDPNFGSYVGGVAAQFGGDTQGAKDAVADFIARTIVEAAKEGKLAGASPSVVAALGNSGANTSDAVDAAVAFGKFFDRIDEIRTPAQSAASALADLNSQMADATAKAQQYGLDVQKVPEIFKANFNDDIASQLKQLTDPTGYALDQLEIQKAADLAKAKELGADINQVEELYAAKRQAIVEQGLQGINNSWQDFFNGLLTGDLSALSPTDQLAQSKSIYDSAVASGDYSQVSSAAQTYLGVAKNYFGATKGYADIYQQVLSDTKSLGGLNVQLPSFDSANSNSSLASYLASLGRNGDNTLLHVNDNEIPAIQAALGTQGTVNPETGYLEFYAGGAMAAGNSAVRDAVNRSYNGGKSNGSGGGGGNSGNGGVTSKNGTAPTNSAVNPGNKNLGLSGPDYSGPTGVGTGVNNSNPNNAPGQKDSSGTKGGGGWDSSYGPAPAGGTDDEGWFNGTVVGSYKDDGTIRSLANGPVDIDKFMHDWADYQGIQYGDLTADTFMDQVGNFLASLVGVTEQNPLTDPHYNSQTDPAGNGANWGWDPLDTALTLAGFAFPPAKIVSTIYSGLKLAGLDPLTNVNLGPSVFGGSTTTSAPVNDNSINSSLNQQRAAGLSSAGTSTNSSSLSAALSGAGTVGAVSTVDNRVTAGFAQQNARLTDLSSTIGKQSRTQDQILQTLRNIQNSQEALTLWTKDTQVRRSA